MPLFGRLLNSLRGYIREHIEYRVGDIVVARERIVEDDAKPNSAAGPCETGWIHCEPGDTGVVMGVTDNGLPTVRFHRTGTATLCSRQEIERV